MVAYTAIMLSALLIGVQATVWGLAELACRYAASHALQTTRVDGGSPDAGEADARTVLDHTGATFITGPDITATRDTTTATVTVTATAVQVIPWLHLPVGATRSAPVETLTDHGEQP